MADDWLLVLSIGLALHEFLFGLSFVVDDLLLSSHLVLCVHN